VIALASGEDRRSEAGDLHDHAHPHPHPHPATEAGPGDEAQPVEPTHGHGSLAHFGLALLSGPPPLPLPLPERAGDVEVDASPHVAALFRPDFPLSRPPPVDATPS
jgi:hypothetical protein